MTLSEVNPHNILFKWYSDMLSGHSSNVLEAHISSETEKWLRFTALWNVQ